MARPAHTRLTYSGVVGAPAAPIEHWSFNLNFPAAALANDASDIAADAKALACRNAFALAMNESFGTDIWLTETRLAAVDAAGHVYTRADGSYVQGISLETMQGTTGESIMPLQTALCVSLNTTRSGPTGKGRFFLPWPTIFPAAGDRLVPVSEINALLPHIGDWLEGVQAALGQQLQVVSSKGYMSEVTSIRVGRAPDTMRSRREDVPEGYITRFLA